MQSKFIGEKDFYKNVARIAIPIALQGLITTGVNMMDTIMVGNLGEVAISASSLANQFYSIFNILCMGISAVVLMKNMPAVVFSMILGTLITLVTPQISTRTLYDEVLNTGNLTPVAELIVSLGYMVLAIVGIRLINLAFTIAYQWMLASILPWVIYDIMLKIFRAMQRQDRR